MNVGCLGELTPSAEGRSLSLALYHAASPMYRQIWPKWFKPPFQSEYRGPS